MDANGFIAKLKGNVSEKDSTDLNKVINEYKAILPYLSTQDKGLFSLNMLCVLCRNLEKIPQWRDGIDNKLLLILSIECVRGTRILEKEDRVKTIACIYHIHRHVVKQNSIPPELILKFSYMPFECDDNFLLSDYHKTYWSILAERLIYIEKLKSNRIVVTKLLPKILEDLLKIVKIYDAVSFCANLLVFLVKKMHLIFDDSPDMVNEVIGKIFDAISKKNTDTFRTLEDKEVMELYVKFNECFVVIIENSIKTTSKGLILDEIVRNCISMLGHHSDIFHCLQTFVLNSFCYMFNGKAIINSSFIETILKNLIVSCETAEKLGYKSTMYSTYPFLCQYIRLYIESMDSVKKDDFGEDVHISCLKFILLLMKKLRITNQMLICENCFVKSGLHDALRLSFLAKNFTVSKLDLKNILPYFCTVVENQYVILYELRSLGCYNFGKCFRKLQTDVHNTAITLNKSQYFETSIKLFNIYLVNEVKNFTNEFGVRNMSRGLYNKSICEVDCNLHEEALKDAYLSLVLAQSEESTDKYMMLVMDIKAKMIKNSTEGTIDNEKSISEDNQDYFQLLSVLDVSKMLLDNNTYGDLRPFMKNLKFSTLLKYEFSMYVKLWPSIMPIAGVWRSINDMAKGKHNSWLPVAEDRDELLNILYEIILETPTVVRSIHNDYCKEIILELIKSLEKKMMKDSHEEIILASLMFLKAEYDFTDAGQKYGWKIAGNTIDPDTAQATRTVPQEHQSMRLATQAVDILAKLIKERGIGKPMPILRHALRIAEMYVQQFLHMQSLAHALQLAYVCCQLALNLDDKESYISNAGIIISYAEMKTDFTDGLIQTATQFVKDLMNNATSLDKCLTFTCDIAIHYKKLEMTGVAAKLVNYVQTRILEVYHTQANINLDLSLGRLMEVQYELCGKENCGQTILSVVNNIQRHYLSFGTSGTSLTARRTKSLLLKHRSSTAGLRAAHTAYSLKLMRRARAAAAAALPRAGALVQALLHTKVTNVYNVDHTRVKIDNCLKHILGLQPTNETQPCCLSQLFNIKHEPFTPKSGTLETMLECATFKKSPSPTALYATVPTFKMPDFFSHTPACKCYGCLTVFADLIACYTCGIEASMFFRAKEWNTARTYYEGTLKMYEVTEKRWQHKMAAFRIRGYDRNVLDVVSCVYRKGMREMLIELLIDASLFELAQRSYHKSDEFVVRIFEIIGEMREVDPYLKVEVYNLMVTSAQLRKVAVTSDLGIEEDFEALDITPDKENDVPKTPEGKCVLAEKTVPKVVNAEEVPKLKRKVIKLNLDENCEEVENNKPKTVSEKSHFKVPIPVIPKPDFENITPRPSRSKPTLIVTQSSQDIEITPKGNEFFTPQSTPSKELFFTPMSSIKTYTKKSSIVKNLEAEFFTPKATKELSVKNEKAIDESLSSSRKTGRTNKEELEKNKVTTKDIDKKKESAQVETGSMKVLRAKRSLKRATSPGKLVKEDTLVTRSRRRQLAQNDE